MPYRRPWSEAVLSVGMCRCWLVAFLLGTAVLRILYLLWDCPLDLAPDEAHYWDWSRHLDWSYYSKGPLVAWLIRTSCELFGSLSVQWSGSLMPAIRLPAVVCGTLLLLSLYVLTVQVFQSERLALGVVAIALSFPLITAGSTLMTIDSPYTCCWGWALVLTHRAIFRESGVSWVLAGLLVGVGILAKYTMVIFLPSVGLFLLTSPEHRPLLRRPGFWGMCIVAGLCCLPILIWNVQNDFVTFRHVHTLAGAKSKSLAWLMGPAIYLGGQIGLLMGVWFFFWLAALIVHRPWREEDPGIRYLWWLSVPMFLLFLGFSPRTEGGEPNWPVTAYISGLVLTAGWLVAQLQSQRVWYRRWTYANFIGVTIFGLALTLCAHHTEWFYPQLSKVVPTPTEEKPMPLRKIDPTCRLRGWRTLANGIDRFREEFRAEGIEAEIACGSWSFPGEVGVYCKGHPPVYSFGLLVGDRHSQYDLWHSPLSDPDAFRGKTFLYIGGVTPELVAGFESVTPLPSIVHRERGHTISIWYVVLCKGFKGFPKPKSGTHF